MKKTRQEAGVKLSDILNRLSKFGLQAYSSVFEAEHIGIDILHTLTDEDLRELGIPLGDRKRMLLAFADSPAAAMSRRQITVLICDLVDSTPLSESTDPEVYREYLQRFRNICKVALEKFEGYIYQYRGDAAIAYFGYPVAQEKCAVRASHAALEIMQALEGLDGLLHGQPQEQPRLRARIGIATGLVIVGADVDQGATQENAVGVTPNMAARLQGLAAPGEVIVCPLTRTLIDGDFETFAMGQQSLKGLRNDVAAFRLLKPMGPAQHDYLPRNRQLTPFCGRAREMRALGDIWHRHSDTLQVAVLQGEAGIGKSRLIREFSRTPAVVEHIHLQYFCSPFHRNSALYPVISQLQRQLSLIHVDRMTEVESEALQLEKLRALIKENLADDIGHLGALAALLGIRMLDNPVDELAPRERKLKFFAAVIALLQAQCRQGKVLVVIEDVHWIDPTTMELVHQLVDSPLPLRCVLLMSARPEFVWPAGTQTQPASIAVEALNSIESSRLVNDASTTGNMSAELVAEIVSKTDGVPLFIEETTRAVAEAGADQENNSDALVTAGRFGVPPTLRDSLMSRLDRLGQSRSTALAASVLGREFSRQLLEYSLNNGTVNLQDDLTRLVESGTLRVRDSAIGVLYQFTHGLLQNIAYESLLNIPRTALHSQVADALLTYFPAVVQQEPEVIAHHLFQAARFEQAADYRRRAGAEASKRGSLQETVFHYRAALDALSKLPQSEAVARQQVGVLSGLAATLLATTSYRSPEVKETATHAIALCKQYGFTLEIAPFLYDIWIGEQGDGNHGVALALAREFLALSEKQQHAESAMVANRAVAWSEFNLGRPRLAIDHLLRSRELYEQQLHKDLVFVYGTDQIVGVGCGQVQSEWCLGYPERALAVAADTLKNAEQSGHVVSIFLALQYAGCLLNSLCRHWEETRDCAKRLMELGEQNNFPQAILAGRFYHHAMNVRLNKDTAAFESGWKIIESTQKLGYLYMMPFWYMTLGDACLAIGQTAEARQCLERAGAIIAGTGEVWHLPEIYRLQGELALVESRQASAASTPTTPHTSAIEEALSFFNKAIALAAGQEAKSWELRARSSLLALQ
ncbi:MAG: AAA family ATPase [Pseudomonadota bacterium]